MLIMLTPNRATAFEAPDYGRVSFRQVQFVRGRLADLVPTLFKQVNPDLDVPMSPLEALYLMAVLIDQKIENEDYQVPPAQRDRDAAHCNKSPNDPLSSNTGMLH
jgi:hypothetical protein